MTRDFDRSIVGPIREPPLSSCTDGLMCSRERSPPLLSLHYPFGRRLMHEWRITRRICVAKVCPMQMQALPLHPRQVNPNPQGHHHAHVIVRSCVAACVAVNENRCCVSCGTMLLAAAFARITMIRGECVAVASSTQWSSLHEKKSLPFISNMRSIRSPTACRNAPFPAFFLSCSKRWDV